MSKIKRDDEIIVTVGKDKGKRGKVLKIKPDGRLLIAGINLIKKHQKPNPQLNVTGGIIEKEAAIQASNVAIFNPTSEKADRIGFKILDDNKKIRVFKSSGEAVDA
tara:strand:+ start:1174 stop:1491 length:318 start_codon:yes stop_codon:yes gene_type:complete